MNDTHGTASRVQLSLRPLFSFAWRALFTLSVCRSVFVVWQWQRVMEADMLASIFLQGLRFDLVLVGLMLIGPVLVFPILASNRLLVPAWRGLLKICLPAVLMLIIFLECSTPSFVDQFDSRPNILFLEYLNHPREVGATLWAAYKNPIVVTILLVSWTTWVNARQISRLVRPIQPIGLVPAILVTPLLVLLCIGMVRSTLDALPTLPVERFHIPGLILGGSVSPALFDRVAVLQKDVPVQQFTYAEGRLSPAATVDADLSAKALAHASWSSMAYEKALYRLPMASER